MRRALFFVLIEINLIFFYLYIAGICLPLAQWNKLVELLPDIEDAIANIPAPAPKASKKK